MSLGNTTQYCPLNNSGKVVAEPVEPPPKKIRVSLFFDGTLNNRDNVIAARLGSKQATADTSYANDFSNISKIERCWNEDSITDHSFSIYIEGIGTKNNQADPFFGKALGTGSTGIHAKVDKGIRQIITNIGALSIVKKKIDYIHLDSFGFSRGAAAARYFIYAALRNGQETIYNQLISQGFTIESGVQIKFVGLFDTVASEGFDHTNDTKVLHLDSISLAKKVVQLAAAEEHRHNFPLTNINSASNGIQIFLPGAHADVGGSYNDNMGETFEIFRLSMINRLSRIKSLKLLDAEKNRLVNQGWYKDNGREISIVGNKRIEVTRKKISNKYSLIPLHIMAKYAEKEGEGLNICVDGFPMPNTYLDNLKQNLNNYISNVGSSSAANDWIKDNSNSMKLLRHNYLHFSSYYDFLNINKPEKNRKRVIHDG